MSGPLSGVRVVEFLGLAPGPFAGSLLADMGAEVVRIDRPELAGAPVPGGLLGRGRRSVCADLKNAEGAAVVLGLITRADLLIEGYRPGVMERLGLGPEPCLARNPALVYGRMTGFGQEGPWAQRAGHDINYISVSGALSRIGRFGQPPTPPLTLVGDFGGGGMLLLFGLLCGLTHARATGRGQVVDAAMVDGSALLMLPFFGSRDPGRPGQGGWGPRGTNMLDSGAPYYDAYETADGRWVSVGAVEPQFYEELVRRMGLDPAALPAQNDQASWPAVKELFSRTFRTRTRDEWCEVFADSDACFAPVLDLAEVETHPHASARGAFVEVDGVLQPAPAPRMSATPGAVRCPPPLGGQDTDAVLAEWVGLDGPDVERLRRVGAVG